MEPERPALTLHEAMVQVLKTCENHTAEQVYLAQEIKKRNLYWQKDGTPVKSNQIGARAKNYPQLFEKIPANRATNQRAKIRIR